jgi:hypothetical protein
MVNGLSPNGAPLALFYPVGRDIFDEFDQMHQELRGQFLNGTGGSALHLKPALAHRSPEIFRLWLASGT